MSVLRPETKEVLRGVRAHEPFFSNMILAELFDDRHTAGPFKVLPYGSGGYLVFDTRLPNGQGVVAGPFEKIEDAHGALLLFANKEENTHE